ncbi:sialic acid-binding Ig-like lectin 10 [Archocentrus centrarchus]|uniref:sialic acid-binding Ig-like lectin 10 n=1 Tax=Archocentrus centrarchus TaxID=63155 RepID=UPI0011EA4D71|nr:sialic acid-binding Ig-like lectin 10 [Archocentrus centrarchus]
MFVLIWAALLFSVRGSFALTGTSVWGNPYCKDEYCVTLNERQPTAEAGLCVVIPCSFMTAAGFKPQHLVWYKCEAKKPKCPNPFMIFHTNNSIKVQSGYEGRVSLLEPDVRQNNCSIIINDLKRSDSGLYQLRVNGELKREQDGFTFIPKVNVSVKGLKQKPTVTIPTLTAGQWATLTCTAPGLCSGSVPQISWTWRGAGGTKSHITGNITSFRTKNTTAFTQTHTSTLTFNALAKHHNSRIICKISFTGETTTERSATLNVTHVKKVKITGPKSVQEGETLNLTCSVKSFPPSLVMWTKINSDINLHSDSGSASLFIQNVTAEHSGLYVCTVKHMNTPLKDNITLTVIYRRKPQITGNTAVKEGDVLNLTCSVKSFPPAVIVWKKRSPNTDLQNGTYTDLHNHTGSATLFIPNVTAEHSGQYICTAKHLDTTMTVPVNVAVAYRRKPQIIGNTAVKMGDVLNLTCSVESFPPALIVWKKRSPNTDLQNGTYTDLHSNTGSATLVIPNVTAEHSGLYICTAKHLDTSVKSYIDVIVTWFSKILDGSGCVLQSEGLTCVCISEGLPLPTIKWPLLKHHTEYSVITTVTNHTVNSTVSLTVRNNGNSSVECVSNNGNGEAKENLPIKRNLAEKNGQSAVFRLKYLKIIIAFLTGILLTSSICCLAQRCNRKKGKSSGKSDETLEMLTHQDDNLVYYDQALQENQTLNSNSEPKEVEYANIDFSLLNRNSARGARRRQESTKTEYAEIKKAVKEEQENDVGRGREISEGEEEKVVMELEMKCCEPEKDEGVEAVYSTVNDIMEEI